MNLSPRARALAWLASLADVTGQALAAEAYLLELITWCALAERPEPDETDPTFRT